MGQKAAFGRENRNACKCTKCLLLVLQVSRLKGGAFGRKSPSSTQYFPVWFVSPHWEVPHGRELRTGLQQSARSWGPQGNNP